MSIVYLVIPLSKQSFLCSVLATTIYHHDHPIHAWSTSAKVSADRALAIISVLRTLSLAEGSYILSSTSLLACESAFLELSDDCQTVITFYSTSLAHVVGASYQAPDVAYLATMWFNSSSELSATVKREPGLIVSILQMTCVKPQKPFLMQESCVFQMKRALILSMHGSTTVS